MSQGSTCIWTGASGAKYTYYVHSLPASFSPNQDGNYIYAKQNVLGQWVPVYIGQGDLASRVSDGHHQAGAIRRKGATHVHEHLNKDEIARTFEESDLLDNYPDAYAPNGCNQRIGG